MSDVTLPNGDHTNCLDLSVLKSGDARSLLRLIYRRVVCGEGTYGPLDLDSDPRDFQQERLEENVDAAVYEAMDVLRRMQSRDEARRTISRIIRERETVMTLTETE